MPCLVVLLTEKELLVNQTYTPLSTKSGTEGGKWKNIAVPIHMISFLGLPWGVVNITENKSPWWVKDDGETPQLGDLGHCSMGGVQVSFDTSRGFAAQKITMTIHNETWSYKKKFPCHENNTNWTELGATASQPPRSFAKTDNDTDDDEDDEKNCPEV